MGCKKRETIPLKTLLIKLTDSNGTLQEFEYDSNNQLQRIISKRNGVHQTTYSYKYNSQNTIIETFTDNATSIDIRTKISHNSSGKQERYDIFIGYDSSNMNLQSYSTFSYSGIRIENLNYNTASILESRILYILTTDQKNTDSILIYKPDGTINSIVKFSDYDDKHSTSSLYPTSGFPSDRNNWLTLEEKNGTFPLQKSYKTLTYNSDGFPTSITYYGVTTFFEYIKR